MRAPRVLLAAYYFPPVAGGGVTRTLALIDSLRRHGAHPSVVTVDDAAWTRDPTLCAGISEVPVVRVPNPDWGRVRRRGTVSAGRPGRGRLRKVLVPDLHVGWSVLAAAVVAGMARANAFDVVYTTAPPYSAHVIGYVARRLGKRWVADFRDAWIDAPDRQGLGPRRLAVEKRLEAAVFRHADRTIFASAGARRRAIARHPNLANRSEVTLTGFDPRRYVGAADPVPTRAERRYRLVHAGNVGLDAKASRATAFLDVLATWRERHPEVETSVDVTFLAAEAWFRGEINRRELQRFVRIEPACSRGDLAARLEQAHRCLHIAPPGPRGADPIPGKLFDALGSRRRLLSFADGGALSELLQQYDWGEAFAPSDTESLIHFLESERRGVLAGTYVPVLTDAARSSCTNEVALEGLVRAILREEREERSRQTAFAPWGATP